MADHITAGLPDARSDPIKTGRRAFTLDMRTFLLPYMFIAAPAMLLINTTFLEAAWIFITATVEMYALAAAMQGDLITEARWYERAVLLVSAVALVKPGPASDNAGFVGFAVVYLLQRRRAPDAPLL